MEGSSHHHQLGFAHQRAADGQHLLFTPAEGTCHLTAAFAQDGKQAVDMIKVILSSLLDGSVCGLRFFFAAFSF